MKDLKDEEFQKNNKSNLELDLNEDDMNKIINEENMKDHKDFLKTFVVENNEVSLIYYIIIIKFRIKKILLKKHTVNC